MNVVYGIQIAEEDDRYVTVASEALESLAIAATPGTFLVDLIPALKYVPAWFPFAGFQRKAAYWRSVSDEFQNRPFNVVKSSMASPSALVFKLPAVIVFSHIRKEELHLRLCYSTFYRLFPTAKSVPKKRLLHGMLPLWHMQVFG
jgi:hypothetical protein